MDKLTEIEKELNRRHITIENDGIFISFIHEYTGVLVEYDTLVDDVIFTGMSSIWYMFIVVKLIFDYLIEWRLTNGKEN